MEAVQMSRSRSSTSSRRSTETRQTGDGREMTGGVRAGIWALLSSNFDLRSGTHSCIAMCSRASGLFHLGVAGGRRDKGGRDMFGGVDVRL
eukprot:2188392-Prymnesium_polylepis.1